MKIVSLNIWGGRLHNELMDFYAKHQDVDIFCLQEVYANAHDKDKLFLDNTNFDSFLDTQKALPLHTGYFFPHLEDWWGLAMFVNNNLEIQEIGEKYVHLQKGHNLEEEKKGYTAKNVQYLKTNSEDKPLTIVNFHGLWNGMGKEDSLDRINQSKKIIEFLNSLTNDFVMCGDFNLSPETKSIHMIEQISGVRNLIKEFDITSTRTSYYPKPNKFADYVFVSSGVSVNKFSVLDEEVSDHKVLLLDVA